MSIASGIVQRRLTACLLVVVFSIWHASENVKAIAHSMSAQDQEFWIEQVAEDLSLPSSMVWLPDGDMLIGERMGDLRAMRKEKMQPTPVSGVPSSFHGIYDGLHDIALDPDFSSNHTLYMLLSEGTFERRHAAVYRARYSAAALADCVRIFRSKDEIGGTGNIATRMMFLSDKTLLVGVAEGHKQGAQQLGSHLGKIVRFNRDGSVPKDNPFVNVPGALPEIWTYGHRVPTGLYQDPESGEVWESEPGPRGGDELNILKAGANYGWAKASWGFAYNNNGLDAPLQTAPGIEEPVVVWTPSVTPAGLTRYFGSVYPMWKGDFFLGHLSGQALERLRFARGRLVLQERLLTDLAERIRDVKVGPDERLYLLTDSGRLLRVQPGRPNSKQMVRLARRPGPTFNAVSRAKARTPELGDALLGKQGFIERCAGCHSIGALIRGGAIGPDLAGIYGRLWGRQEGFEYSQNMADSLFVWDAQSLDQFLADPAGVVPGTRMAATRVTDAKVRGEIIAFLQQQSEAK